VIEGGGRWPDLPWRLPRLLRRLVGPTPRGRLGAIPAVIAVAALAAGLVAGYAAGERHARHGSGGRAGSAVIAAGGGAALVQAGVDCSARAGGMLQLGVQVTNQSAVSLRLDSVRAVLPLGGLRVAGASWGVCGELPAVGQVPVGQATVGQATVGQAGGMTLPAGASGWFTVTFAVLMSCPAPLPVQFTVGYEQRGERLSARLPGFPDLGQVPYPGCGAG
jgi:hypothetical protein